MTTSTAELAAFEVQWNASGEDHYEKAVAVWTPAGQLPRSWSFPAVSNKAGGGVPTTVSGTLLYADRRYDASGYLPSIRRLPARRVRIDMVVDGASVPSATAFTDDTGRYEFVINLSTVESWSVRAVSELDPAVVGATRVVDQVGPGGDLTNSSSLAFDVASVSALVPGAVLDLGEALATSNSGAGEVQALNLLDCALDVADLLADSAYLGAGFSGTPPIVWWPTGVTVETRFLDGAIHVAAPGSGDSDGWSDGLVLAAIGQWALSTFSRLDTFDGQLLQSARVEPKLAHGNGAALAFAALVRSNRSQRLDADGQPADDDVAQIVDLPAAPPVGFPASSERALDLERRVWDDGTGVRARGQQGVDNVACMHWDLIDGTATPAPPAGDDDGIDGDGQAWFDATLQSMSLPGNEAITYEDVHLAWIADNGDSPALADVAVTMGGTALYDDAAEPDDVPAQAVALPVWVQPAPGGTQVVLNEVMVGDTDAVELSNASLLTVDVGGWRVVTARNGFGAGVERTTTLPVGTTIDPGRFLLVQEGIGTSTGSNVFDANWQVPWTFGADGACTLLNAAGSAVDFVRWGGSGGPSTEPVPGGQSFSGNVDGPGEGFSLARDSVSTDSDSAADFQVSPPTARVPNVAGLDLRTLFPRDGLDHIAVDLPAATLVEVGALLTVDAAQARLTDQGGASGVVNSDGSAELQLYAAVATTAIVQLDQLDGGVVAAAVDLIAWDPYFESSQLPVTNLLAQAQLVQVGSDDVMVTWTNTGVYDSLRVDVDGQLRATLPGSSQNHIEIVASGHATVSVTPVRNGQAGATNTTGVYVGVPPCDFDTGFEGLDILQFDLIGWDTFAPGLGSAMAARDAASAQTNYSGNEEATITLRDPVGLYADAFLRFDHACHLVPDGDAAFVEVSVDDGFSWDTLLQFDGSDHDGSGAANWLDTTLESADWVSETISLAAYAGRHVLLRFRRVSNGSGENIGWTIDNLELAGFTVDGEHWITTDGRDDLGCGHPQRGWASFGQALAAAGPNDTIRYGAGTFTTPTLINVVGNQEPVMLPVPPGRTVLGTGSETTIIDAGLATWGMLVTSDVPDATPTTVQGLQITSVNDPVVVTLANLTLEDVVLRGFQTGVLSFLTDLSLVDCLVAQGSLGIHTIGGNLKVENSTLVDIVDVVRVGPSTASATITRSILAHGFSTLLEVQEPAAVLDLECNNFYNSPTPFVGLPSPIGSNDNFQAIPQFCNRGQGNYKLASTSPLLNWPGCGAVGYWGQGCAGVTSAPVVLPSSTGLTGLVPNPFNPSTEIRYAVDQPGEVRLDIYDVRGRRVRELVAYHTDAGRFSLNWNGRDDRGRSVASGVYLVRWQSAGKSDTRRAVLIR